MPKGVKDPVEEDSEEETQGEFPHASTTYANAASGIPIGMHRIAPVNFGAHASSLKELSRDAIGQPRWSGQPLDWKTFY